MPIGAIDYQPKEVDCETKMIEITNVDLAKNAPLRLLNNIYTYDKMIRIFAWILIFLNVSGYFNRTQNEIDNSEKYLIGLFQRYYLYNNRCIDAAHNEEKNG